jgi:hypothetical protein
MWFFVFARAVRCASLSSSRFRVRWDGVIRRVFFVGLVSVSDWGSERFIVEDSLFRSLVRVI